MIRFFIYVRSVILRRMETIDIHHPTSPHNMSIFFHVSMWWRIFYGFLRIILGTALLRIIGQPLSEFVFTLMSHEITGKRSDIILSSLYKLLEIHDFKITYFLASYFIFWGLVDVVLSACLLRYIRKAFPIALGLIILFILYGIFRFTHTHSLILLGVIVLDMIILYLIHYEYRSFGKTN